MILEENESRLQVVIFSKDRPLQLDATLRSFISHCLDFEQTDVRVIVKASNIKYGQAYSILEKEYLPFENILLIAEDDFRQQVINLVRSSAYVLWLVDDNIFVRNFTLSTYRDLLQSYRQALGYSLRLGQNTSYCYSLDMKQAIPGFTPIAVSAYAFDWTTAEADFGYPLEVSSSLYRTADLLPLLESLSFNNPNTLESGLAALSSSFKNSHPYLLCSDFSNTFCNPVNKVQDSFSLNRAGSNRAFHPPALLDCYLTAQRIDVEAYNDFIPDACHQEVPLVMIKPASASPKVSLIIPCYNQAHFLANAVESVIAQTFTDWECLIVNDGSPDNTSEVARQLITEHSEKQIKLLEKENSGLADTRNYGIAHSRGKYILPLDSDDILHPDMLLKTVHLLDTEPNISIAYTDLVQFGAVSCHIQSGEYDFDALRYANHLNYCSLYRREAWESVGGYNPNMVEGYEDWDFWISCGAKEFWGRRIPEVLFYYRVKEQSMYTKAMECDARLKAQIVSNHPQLYDDRHFSAAQRYLGMSR